MGTKMGTTVTPPFKDLPVRIRRLSNNVFRQHHLEVRFVSHVLEGEERRGQQFAAGDSKTVLCPGKGKPRTGGDYAGLSRQTAGFEVVTNVLLVKARLLFAHPDRRGPETRAIGGSWSRSETVSNLA